MPGLEEEFLCSEGEFQTSRGVFLQKKRMVNRQSSRYPQSYEYKRLYIVSEFQMWVGALEVVAVSEMVARVCSCRRPAGQGSITQSSASQRAAWGAKWRTDTWDRLKMQLLSVSARRVACDWEKIKRHGAARWVILIRMNDAATSARASL